MTFVAPRPLTALALLAALAACSDGGDGGGLPNAFDRQLAEAEALIDASEDEAFTPQDALPTGTATYNGVIVLADESDDAYGVAGDLDLTIDFADLEVGGQITNVADSDGRSYDGVLDVGVDYDGVSGVDPSADPETEGEHVFDANFGGTLTAGLDSWVVDGSLEGDLAGPDADFAGGTAEAQVCLTGGLDCTDLTGLFIAD